jgi:hypothetical protein
MPSKGKCQMDRQDTLNMKIYRRYQMLKSNRKSRMKLVKVTLP